MRCFEKQDGVAFILISYTHRNEYYYLTFKKLTEFWDRAAEGGRKSFRYEELEPAFFLPEVPGILVPYLNTLQLDLNCRAWQYYSRMVAYYHDNTLLHESEILQIMENQLLHTPDGVRDIYNGECKKKLYLQDKLHRTLLKYGYHDIMTPTFEFFNIFWKRCRNNPFKGFIQVFWLRRAIRLSFVLISHLLLQEVRLSTI